MWSLLNPDGRSSRGEYAIVWFSVAGIAYVLSATVSYSSSDAAGCMGVVAVLFAFASIPVGIIAAIRRFHDLGESGLMAGWMMVPLVNLHMFLRLLFVPGAPEDSTPRGYSPSTN